MDNEFLRGGLLIWHESAWMLEWVYESNKNEVYGRPGMRTSSQLQFLNG